MKVYQATMPYYDGDHDHGQWRSPLFSTREAAEAFLAALRALPENDSRRWWSDHGYCDYGPDDATISEIDVVESFNGEIPHARECLAVTYT